MLGKSKANAARNRNRAEEKEGARGGEEEMRGLDGGRGEREGTGMREREVQGVLWTD